MQDEMDILKEIGNIASAHGSIALSEILGSRIELSVPETSILAINSLNEKINVDKIGIAVSSKLITGLRGKVIFLLDERNAFKLNDISYKVKKEDKNAGVLTEMGMSLIKEVGSMVTGAYVSALSMLFKEMILLAPPSLISGTIEEVLNMTLATSDTKDNKNLVLIDVEFKEPADNLEGNFFLVLTCETALDIQKKCKQMLEDISNR